MQRRAARSAAPRRAAMEVYVQVERAAGLRNLAGAFGGVSDPFVEIEPCLWNGASADDAMAQRTLTIQDTMNPEWNEVLKFEFSYEQFEAMLPRLHGLARGSGKLRAPANDVLDALRAELGMDA